MVEFRCGEMLFEWDDAKAASNLVKHGVSFQEAASAFLDERGILIPDEKHSADEARFLLIGTTTERKILIVSHVDRVEKLRVISARFATPKERRDYEQSGY